MSDKSQAWPRNQSIAGVSSFGFGGTNAHVLLERVDTTTLDLEEQNDFSSEYELAVLGISARSRGALQDMCSALADRIEKHDESLPNLAAALHHYRAKHSIRFAIPCTGTTRDEAISALRDMARGEPSAGAFAQRPGHRSVKVMLLIGDQLPDATAMVRYFARGPKVFRVALEQAQALLSPWIETDLTSLCDSFDKNEKNHRALCFAAQYSLVWALQNLRLISSELIGIGRAKILADALSTSAVTQAAVMAWMNDDAANGPEEKAAVLAEFSEKLDNDPLSLLVSSGTFTKMEAHTRHLCADQYLEIDAGLSNLFSELFSLGVDLPSEMFATVRPACVDALPLYPFQLERYWMVAGDAEELAMQVTQRRLSPSTA